jgi:4'-phosphopantetheinyl transferase
VTAALREGEVDVWMARLTSIDDTSTQALGSLLSQDERNRADAFPFVHHRRDYVVAHALLRVTLARYLSCDPTGLTFASSVGERPALAGSPSPFDFSLSHTEGLAAVAVCRAATVGLDAEDFERAGDHVELADRHFDADEARALRALGAVPRRRRFVELWTLKEAYSKARGVGLSLPLDRVSFTVARGRPPHATFAPELAHERGRWKFALLHPTSRHILAIARSGSWPLAPRVFAATSADLVAAARLNG